MKNKKFYMQHLLKHLTILILVNISSSIAWSGEPFHHVFAPQEGLVTSVEQPWRKEICLNGYWEFQPVAGPGTTNTINCRWH